MTLADIEYPTPWVKTLEGVRKAEIDFRDVSMYQFIKERGEQEPNNIGMVLGVKGGKSLNYGQILDSIKRMAVGLSELGVKKGSRVALMLPNLPQYVICHYAILSLGAVVVQTNPLYTDRELKHIVHDSRAEGIISITRFQPQINKLVDDDATTLKWAVFANISDYMSPIIAFLAKRILKKLDDPKIDQRENRYLYKNMLNSADVSKFKEAEIDFDNDQALLQYTGGTTGLSKGASLSHKNISYNAQQLRECIHMIPDGQGSVLTALPLFHSFALTVCMGIAILTGIPMILVPNPREQIPAGEVHALIEKHKVTFAPAVPTMIVSLSNHPKAETIDWSSIIACLSGGAALPLATAQHFKKVTGADVVEGYGLSETSPVLTANPILSKVQPKEGSIGLPVPNTVIRIADPEDSSKTMPIGEAGEIVAQGPQVMQGYFEQPEENAITIVDGWFLTGDIGYMDEDGFTFIIDRKKELIIVSGNNVYPREVEEVLHQHPAVLEASVAGIKDEVKGELVGAWIVIKEGQSASEDDIIQFCKDNLAAYKIPKQVTFRDELPKSMIGKVLRRKLTEPDED